MPRLDGVTGAGGVGGVAHGWREVEEVQQIGLCRITRREMRGARDEAVLDKLDDRGVVHGNVRDIVFTHEGGDHEVGHPETKLRPKPLLCRGVGTLAPGSLAFRSQCRVGVPVRERHGMKLSAFTAMVEMSGIEPSEESVNLLEDPAPAARDRKARLLRRS